MGARAGFESLERLFEELEDEERFSDKKEAGVSEAADVSGVRPLPLVEAARE